MKEAMAAADTPPGHFILACVGDVMPAGRAADALRRAGAKPGNRQIWQGTEGANAVLMNLEAPITDAAVAYRDKRYSFKCDGDVLAFFDRRFIFSLANNHTFDFGEKGLLDTIDALDAHNFLHAGAGRNLEEARRPAMLDCGSAGMGVLCAADPRYQPATNSSAGTFPAVPGLLRESIRELQRSARIVIVSIHCGQEFLPVPSPRQIQLAGLSLDAGASVVSFHHAHCTSGVQKRKKGVVVFGSGNYVFPRGDTPRQYVSWRESAVWRIILDPVSQDIEMIDIRPVMLDDDGLPCVPPAGRARAILNRIALHSERLSAPRRLRWWRARAMMSPLYLWMNLINYTDIARRDGVRACLRTLASGLAAQLDCRQQD